MGILDLLLKVAEIVWLAVRSRLVACALAGAAAGGLIAWWMGTYLPLLAGVALGALAGFVWDLNRDAFRD